MFLSISAAIQTKDNACDFMDIEFIMSLLLNVEKNTKLKITNIVVHPLFIHIYDLVTVKVVIYDGG